MLKQRRHRGRRLTLCVAATIGLVALPAAAAVTSTIVERYYSIGGTTEKSIVRYMRQHPYRGDNGHAYANLKHRYKLSLDTEASGGICRVKDIDLRIDFTMTLPRSANPGALTASAKRSFDGFVNFARKHELHHKASFIACGQKFVAKARRMSASQCFSLESDIRALLKKSDAACEAGERPFDRQQSKAVNGLSLFVKGRR